ncbi:MAG TPA: 5-deoxy-glucuronate isomerase, partial [Ktedonobacteraceae bacterium]|nr:5-deoxy-glucuronate isomerase [Ktedonobacteraceae bacterium]
MRQYNSHNLVVHPGNTSEPDVVVEVTPELAGWDYISFQLRRLPAQHSWTYATGDKEMAIVVLSGRLSVDSGRGQWSHIGERDSVFSGLPSALYLPRHTPLVVTAETDCEYAVAQAPTDQDH